jgi:hypothetical protein
LNALAVHSLYAAPLAVWLMDDQNIFARGIADNTLNELFERASVRFAICDEMKTAYEKKFGLAFQVQLPVERSADLCRTPLPACAGRGPRIATCGNIWCEQTLREFMAIVRQTGVKIDWFGNLGRPFQEVTSDELRDSGIFPQGELDHAQLIARLRSYDLGLVVMPTDVSSERSWQTRLSFPSKIITLAFAANLPLLYLGDETSPGARFLTSRQLGVVSALEPEAFSTTLRQLNDAATSTHHRQVAASQAQEFCANSIAERLWSALEARRNA